MSKKAVYRIRRIGGIAILILGIHLMVAYTQKVLPFGLVTDDVAIIGAWAYTGIWIAMAVITYGLTLTFGRLINCIINYFISLE